MFRTPTRFKRDGDLAHTTPRQCCRSWNCRAPKIEIRRRASNRTSHLKRSECSTLPCRLARSACSRSMSSIGETENRVKTCPCAHAPCPSDPSSLQAHSRQIRTAGCDPAHRCNGVGRIAPAAEIRTPVLGIFCGEKGKRRRRADAQRKNFQYNPTPTQRSPEQIRVKYRDRLLGMPRVV